MLLYLSIYEYLIESRYNSRWFDMNVITSMIGKCWWNIDITMNLSAAQCRYIRCGKWDYIYVDTNMSLRCYTTVVHLSWTLILVSLDHAKRISVSWFIYMLSSKILESWQISHQLSEYYYVIVNRYYCSLLHLNLNSCITGKCKNNCCTTMYFYAVQSRYYQPGKCYMTYPNRNLSLRTDTTIVHFI
jgi:hypothetical protein